MKEDRQRLIFAYNNVRKRELQLLDSLAEFTRSGSGIDDYITSYNAAVSARITIYQEFYLLTGERSVPGESDE